MSWATRGIMACVPDRERDTPVTAADKRTSQADWRTAACLAAGVAEDNISRLGYDHSDAGYRNVRRSWTRHLAMHGLAELDHTLAEVCALWLEARPDLAAGDDWQAAGAAGHASRYPGGCGRTDSLWGPCILCYPASGEPEEAA